MARNGARAVVLLAAVVGAFSVAGPASASLPGPGTMSLGFTDTLFTASTPSLSTWLARGRALGSSFVRVDAYWATIAPAQVSPGFAASNPSDPGYRWAALDTVVRAATARDQSIVMSAWDAPDWAEQDAPPRGVRNGTWLPNPDAFALFARALAQRYSGSFPDPLNPGRALPRVRYFQAWNEPNLPDYLMPQWSRESNGTWQPVSPGIYRALLNSFYSAVKAVMPSDFVLAAGTAPYGDPPATGQGRMAPVTFLKNFFCLSPRLGPAKCSDPPHLDALDHHPYGIGPTVHARQSGDVGTPDLGKIETVLHAAQRFHRVLPDGPKPLWVTEIDWTSRSPGTPAAQARDLALGFYELWSQGVSHVFWFELRDPPQETNSFRNAGLYYSNGTPKPAAAAYRFPFVALPARRGQLTLWGRAPYSGRVAIEELTRGRWRRVLGLQTTSGGIFYAVRPLGRRLILRALEGGVASPPWATG